MIPGRYRAHRRHRTVDTTCCGQLSEPSLGFPVTPSFYIKHVRFKILIFFVIKYPATALIKKNISHASWLIKHLVNKIEKYLQISNIQYKADRVIRSKFSSSK
ncbi:hypothetical protein GDO81_027059 [Engystomops pustulosus]|uniref:Uncharacterized protein n=1 Tax=Engystomops pustulosus TaxID=76066 RepID=A0AAV6YHG4_ENGPU|nr:hypothetical protein GDO81_027059 [Engystomops pustulosus]